MTQHRRVYAQIDLQAIKNNVKQMKRNLPDKTQVMAVVKADGYGHGAVPAADILEPEPYVWGFAVATLEEGIELRRAGIHKPILILGNVYDTQYDEVIAYKLTAAVFKYATAKGLSAAAERSAAEVSVHIKIDTGMNRIGYRTDMEAAKEISQIVQLPGIRAEGIFTHFVKADETDKTFSYQQLSKFRSFIEVLKEKQVTFPLIHCAGSAGIIDLNGDGMDLVRAGIAMYGIYPSDEVKKDEIRLTPALELISEVVYVKEIEAGDTISYGATFQAADRMKIATIPVGYGDGYPRSLSNCGYVLIRGQKAPIRGRICMDQFMVDVTDIEGTAEGDRVVLVGKDEEETLSVDTLAELSGRFPYEFVCDLGKRIPRIYKK